MVVVVFCISMFHPPRLLIGVGVGDSFLTGLGVVSLLDPLGFGLSSFGFFGFGPV